MGSRLSEMFDKQNADQMTSGGYLPVDWYEEQLCQVFAKDNQDEALGSLTVITAELLGKVRKLERDYERSPVTREPIPGLRITGKGQLQ